MQLGGLSMGLRRLLDREKLIVLFVGSGLFFWQMGFWLLGFWKLGRQTPADLSLLHIAAWMLTGPLAVMAAQGLTVLAMLTAIRIDLGIAKAHRGRPAMRGPKTEFSSYGVPRVRSL